MQGTTYGLVWDAANRPLWLSLRVAVFVAAVLLIGGALLWVNRRSQGTEREKKLERDQGAARSRGVHW